MNTETVIRLLGENPQVSDYKINLAKKESYELFYVKGKLETVRATDTQDQQVTVYTDHDGFRGDSVFYIYPSTTEKELQEKISSAVCNARMICNAPYTLPGAETADVTLPTNLQEEPLPRLADRIARLSFGANTHEDGSINALEIFLNRHRDSVYNSRGLSKTQHYYTAMVEAIPTFNGNKESVELYEQYNFSALSQEALTREISEKMDAVKARYQAEKPDFPLNCKVVFGRQELNEFFTALAGDLDYGTVYGHGNCFKIGDRLQEGGSGDPLTLTMRGSVEGNVMSSAFDGDGLSLGEITLIRDGSVENYYGSNRFGQYLGVTPTGILPCLCVAPGTLGELPQEGYLEVLSMSGLQVDFFNDYMGGEIRLACYHCGDKQIPLTGISISGSVREAFRSLKLSSSLATQDGYTGPAQAVFDNLKIF